MLKKSINHELGKLELSVINARLGNISAERLTRIREKLIFWLQN